MAAAAKKSAAKKAAPAKKAAENKPVEETPTDPDLMGDVTPDIERGEAKRADAPKAAAKLGSAAERRGNYLAGLKQERGDCERLGKDARVKEIDAEIRRVESVKGRSDANPSDEA